MNHKGLYIGLLLAGCLMLSTQKTSAQLLQDRNKLKAAEKKWTKPFIIFKKNVKPSKRSKVVRASQPKFSHPATPKKYNVNPKYSHVSAPKYEDVSPRYTRPNAPVKIRDSKSHKAGFLAAIRFNTQATPGGTDKKTDLYNMSSYIGKQKKQKKGKDMYPSANYLTAKHNDSKWVRDTKRKFNVTWIAINGNKTQPKAVKEKPKKVKFDKNEKEIWNN